MGNARPPGTFSNGDVTYVGRLVGLAWSTDSFDYLAKADSFVYEEHYSSINESKPMVPSPQRNLEDAGRSIVRRIDKLCMYLANGQSRFIRDLVGSQ